MLRSSISSYILSLARLAYFQNKNHKYFHLEGRTKKHAVGGRISDEVLMPECSIPWHEEIEIHHRIFGSFNAKANHQKKAKRDQIENVRDVEIVRSV
jgi:hypothetical protein